VYADAAAAKLQLSTAMADEVRYSRFLNDLSLTIPSNVWITDVKLAKKSASPVAATTPGAVAPATLVAGPVPLGELTFKGIGFAHDDVASWLDALVKVNGLSEIYFDKSAEGRIGQRLVVNFDSTATVTSGMQSGRYKKAS
jgi:Tfp pilus assembly protein PilN